MGLNPGYLATNLLTLSESTGWGGQRGWSQGLEERDRVQLLSSLF